MTIEYTARPILLLFAGDLMANDAALNFEDTNANMYPEVTASAQTEITSVSPAQDPRSLGFWRNHEEEWTSEVLLRIQATDDRFDGADGSLPDGMLSTEEVEAVLAPGGNQTKVLSMQLLATYFNLATRRINANTRIESSTALDLALVNVRDAVLYAVDNLELPVDTTTRRRCSGATTVLDEINNNQSEVC